MRFQNINFLVGIASLTAFGHLYRGAAHAAVVPFDMVDVAVFSSAPPTTIVATTAQFIPGGIDNSGAGNEFNLSSIQFDIDGDLDPLEPDPSIFFDFQVRTATFVGGQIVFDGFTHVFPPAPQNGSYVVTKNENSYLNFPFAEGDLIGDGVDEFVRDGFSPPGPPNNNTFSVGLDEGGAVRFFAEGVDNFVGFKLDSGDYGWIRVQFDSTAGGGVGSLTFLDGAYDDTGAAIAAGDVGSGVEEDADFDADGDVDGDDFLAWQRGLGLSGAATLGDGDADGDLDVDDADLLIWNLQFAGAGSLTSITPVPEPTGFFLAAWTTVFIMHRRYAPN